MARPVHPSHPPQQAPHSGAAGAHPDPHAPAGAPAKPGFGKRALDNASEVVENWAAQRTRRPLANSGIGNAAREAMGGLTKGSQALAAGALHNQDPYSVASVASETIGAARTIGNMAKTHVGDALAGAVNHGFSRKGSARSGTSPAASHGPHPNATASGHGSPHPAPTGGAPGGASKKPIFGGATPAAHAETTARDQLGKTASDVQNAARSPVPSVPLKRDTGVERG
jgi:hypothetical protein